MSKTVRGVVLAWALALGLLPWAAARGPLEPGAMPPIALAELPKPGAEVYARILQGGPFPFEKDGTVFFNRERLLPPSKKGYYREYTVPTPGLSHRGPRRIVCGGPPTQPDACYYTADHYESFRRIQP